MAFSLNDYTDLKEIGSGGMSIVYSAAQKSLEREVVIKKMVAHLVPDLTLQKRFENEAKSAASLDHKNIIKIYDFGTDKGSFYICMEYVNGPSFEDLLRIENFPKEIGLMILLQALQGLEHAHAKGIIHRDVKPANILVSRNGTAKVLDFGIAYAGEDTGLTIADNVIGSPLYMSPEQASGGKEKDIRMDIFSVGIMMYRILTGNFPFTGENIPSLLLQIVHDKEKDVGELANAFPDDLLKFVRQCMQKDMNNRLFSLKPLLDALQNYFYTMGIRDISHEISKYVLSHQAKRQYDNSQFIEFRLRQGKLMALAGKLLKARAQADEVLRQIPDEPRALKMVSDITSGNFGDYKKEVSQQEVLSKLEEEEFNSPRVFGKSTRVAAFSGMLLVFLLGIGVALFTSRGSKDQTAGINVNTGTGLSNSELAAKRATVVDTQIVIIEKEMPAPAKASKKITSKKSKKRKKKIKKKPNKEVAGTGSLHVFSRPWANIYINGKRQGTSPTKMPLILNSGKYTVVLKKPGFKDVRRSVSISRDKISRLRIDLTRN